MFIHGLKSLIRRPAKTAMLFVILFIVFNLIFVGFIIQNSVQQSKSYIRSQIGGYVEYQMDYSSFMNTAQKPGTQTGGQTSEMTQPAALSLSVAEKMASSQYVASYYITESTNVSSDTVDPAETQETSGGFQMNFSDFTLSGSNNVNYINFVTGDVTLSDGAMPTEDNLKNGDKVVMISEDVADANDLRVGDTISLATVTRSFTAPSAADQGGQQASGNQQPESDTTTGDSYDYVVVGIYQTVSEAFDVNTIFTSNTVIVDLNGTAGSDETTGSIVYLLNNAEDVDAFVAENTPYLTSEYHTLYSNDEQYTSLTKPLNLISFIVSILIWVVFIAGAAIILAIVTIFVRDRKFEIGLLLSSGEGKLRIISQFVFEMLVIAVIAFSISIVSSNVISKSVSSWIVENELLSTSSLIGSTSTTTTEQNGMGMQRPGDNTSDSVYGSVDMEGVAAQFNVQVSGQVVLELFFASALLVLIGSMIPLTAIMGFNPKRILQDY
jgi:putative ABC transport system permease protein